MKLRYFLVLSFIAMSLLSAEVVDVPGGTAVDVKVPDGWELIKMQPDATIPPTVTFTQIGDSSIKMKVTFMPDSDGRFSDKEKINRAVNAISGQYVGGSVEGVVRLIDLTNQDGIGCYAQFTDVNLVGAADAPGKYKVVATGLLVVGKTAGAITILANSFAQPGYAQAVALLNSGISMHK